MLPPHSDAGSTRLMQCLW